MTRFFDQDSDEQRANASKFAREPLRGHMTKEQLSRLPGHPALVASFRRTIESKPSNELIEVQEMLSEQADRSGLDEIELEVIQAELDERAQGKEYVQPSAVDELREAAEVEAWQYHQMTNMDELIPYSSDDGMSL